MCHHIGSKPGGMSAFARPRLHILVIVVGAGTLAWGFFDSAGNASARIARDTRPARLMRCQSPLTSHHNQSLHQVPTQALLDTCPNLTADDQSMQPHLWSGSPIVIRPLRMIYCGIPKNGCTLMKRFAMRIDGNPAWNTRKPGLSVHKPQDNGLLYLRDLQLEAADTLMHSTEWIRLVVVRDPMARFAAAFLDKCRRRAHDARSSVDPNCPVQHPVDSLDEDKVLAKLERDVGKFGMKRINRHFLPQSNFCDMLAFSFAYLAIEMDNLAGELSALINEAHVLPSSKHTGWHAFNETIEYVKSVNHDTSSRTLAKSWLDAEKQCTASIQTAPRACDGMIAARLRKFYRQDYDIRWNGVQFARSGRDNMPLV
jgi:hypothetical protein